MNPSTRTDLAKRYREVLGRVRLLLDGESDWVAAMATVVCELHGTFDHFDWTGFYRAENDHTLVDRSVPGRATVACASRSGEACAVRPRPAARPSWSRTCTRFRTTSPAAAPPAPRSSCRSFGPGGRILAVLDVDSDRTRRIRAPSTSEMLEELCRELGERYG